MYNMDPCSECLSDLPADGDFVICYRCDRKMHYGCTTLSEKSYRKMTTAKKEEWKCPACRKELLAPPIPKSSDENTPTQSMNKRLRSVSSPDGQDQGTSSSNATKNYESLNNDILNEIRKMRKEMTDIKSSCVFLANKYDEIKNTMDSNNELLRKLSNEINALKESNTKKDQQIFTMETKINALQQQLLKNNIEIQNSPPIQNENLAEFVQALGKTINVNLCTADITDVYRSNKKNPNKSTIVVSFANQTCKYNFIKKAKAKRSITLTEIIKNTSNVQATSVNERNDYIYVNNHLTPTNKHLLLHDKNKARDSNWKFVWESNGKILAKKHENGGTIHIGACNDVDKICN